MDTRITRRGFLAGGLGAVLGWLRPLAGVAAGGPKRVDLICRGAWGAEKAGEGLVRHRIRRLTVHHSAIALTDNREAPARFRSHQAAHQERGWPDIAYHLLIDRNGNVYQGRRWRYRGDTATNYDPKTHLLVLCEGNFDEQGSTKAQVAALVDVLAWASERFGVRPGRIAGHRDYASTACPGDRLYRLIEDRTLRRRVRRRLRSGGVELERLCGTAGRRRVRRIEAGKD